MLVLGIDPGKHTGWALLEFGGLMPVFVDGGALKPAFDKSDEPAQALQNAIAHAELVAVESVRAVYPRARFCAGMATALLDATRVEEKILALANRAGVHVATCTAAEWRRALLPRRIRSATQTMDARVKSVLEVRMGTLPRLSCHARDAIATALFCEQRRRLKRAEKIGS